MNEFVLTGQEKLIFKLRELFSAAGYKRFRLSKFEDYDLYSGFKDFLVSEDIISFTDIGGSLKALKPDVTLSIVRSAKPVPGRTESVAVMPVPASPSAGANASPSGRSATPGCTARRDLSAWASRATRRPWRI